MQQVFITLSLFFLTKATSGQNLSTYDNGMLDCWKYYISNDTTYGEVVVYVPNPVLCGKIPTASIALIKTVHGDTLRLIRLCSYIGELSVGEKIKLYPSYLEQLPKASIMLPEEKTAMSCNIKKTSFAPILKTPSR